MNNDSKLLNDQILENSTVVANCRMNRERGVVGVNSYSKELKINILQFLAQKITTQNKVKWLDLGCGTGIALVETATFFKQKNFLQNLDIQGIDLVDMFADYPPSLSNLSLKTSSLHQWQATEQYDLITAVHSLHYIGDKLSLIQKALRGLKPEGLFIANLSLDNIQVIAKRNGKSLIMKCLKENLVEYKPQSKLIICRGIREMNIPFRYVGADDQVGPNYTKQEVVNSYYE
jgi:2-polyprenyl-3-methyl-5-hydroxy-6-metoxy-1,4-benzoquinol methylase